jgi:hypothetical protein
VRARDAQRLTDPRGELAVENGREELVAVILDVERAPDLDMPRRVARRDGF